MIPASGIISSLIQITANITTRMNPTGEGRLKSPWIIRPFVSRERNRAVLPRGPSSEKPVKSTGVLRESMCISFLRKREVVGRTIGILIANGTKLCGGVGKLGRGRGETRVAFSTWARTSP
jgi:hypothetical protein